MRKEVFTWNGKNKKIVFIALLCITISILIQNYAYAEPSADMRIPGGAVLQTGKKNDNNKASKNAVLIILTQTALHVKEINFWHIAAPSAILSVFIILLFIDRNKHRKIIQKLKTQDEYINHMANYDDLTNLPNHKLFIKTLESEIKNGHCGSILLLDVDNFNSIKDTLGHEYGYSLLKEIASRLSAIDPGKFYVSRMDSDEFTILIYEEDKDEVIVHYIQKIYNALKKSLIINDHENFISVSIGVTRFPIDGANSSKLLANADTAMYKVKHSGKNNYMFYEEDMLKEIKNRSEIVAILCNALKTNGFRLVYQPQVNTRTGEITGFEALLRLKNHNIAPNEFIPVAEETGLIIEIGRWVAKEAIEQLARWKKNAFQLKPIAINYSNRQLQDDGFDSFLKKTLVTNGIDAKFLEIEITESILLNKTENAIRFLNSIKNMGIHMTLDDFGTGFSSISYLTFIPVFKIKIDKTICNKFLEVESDKVINDMISMLHSLGLEITAEGVEQKEQYRKLKKFGCDYIQGFLFSKPIPVDEVEKIYSHNMLTVIDENA